MFDAKNLLEMMVRGAAPAGRGDQPGAATGGGGLADILGQIMQSGGAAKGANTGQAGETGGMGGLGDLVRNFGGGQQGGADVLGKLQEALAGKGGTSGGLGDLLGNVLGQATGGVRDGAAKIDSSTGASANLRDMLGQMTGKSPDELMAQVKDLIANNQMGVGAALGGLGTLILGTQSGRSVASSAAKLGALALIGGLAYRALQNYQSGQQPAAGGEAAQAPTGSGFEPEAVSNEAAITYIRAMIAAAASDGRLDATEQERIVGSLKVAGLDAEAEEFLANEMANPATVDALAEGIETKEEAIQLYTAARIAINPDTAAETQFLSTLASRLEIDDQLATHIGAAAKAA